MPTARRIVRKSPAESRVVALQFIQAIATDATLESITVAVTKAGTFTQDHDLAPIEPPTSTSELTAIPADIGGTGIHTDRQVNLLVAAGTAGTRYRVEVRATVSTGAVVSGFLCVDVL